MRFCKTFYMRPNCFGTVIVNVHTHTRMDTQTHTHNTHTNVGKLVSQSIK